MSLVEASARQSVISVPRFLLFKRSPRFGKDPRGRARALLLSDVFPAVSPAGTRAAADRGAEVAVGLALQPGGNFLQAFSSSVKQGSFQAD